MSKIDESKRENIKKSFGETGSIRATAELVGVGRNTVRRCLMKSGNGAISRTPKSSPRPSKLDPYKAKVRFLLDEKHLSAIRILEEIKEAGYTGGYSILKDYLRAVAPTARKKPRPPIDHRPGHEGQMDWSPHKVLIGGKESIVQTGSIVLCFSRWLFFRHCHDQTLPSVIRLHQEAFAELGAVPRTMTYDNMTTVGRHVDGKIWINPTFQKFAQEYNFEIIILPPGAKERHGAVERPFHYIENNFLAGREFVDFEELNVRADQWRNNQANVRVHGTLRERPVDRLQRERSFLLPLPINKSDHFYKEVDRLVHVDFSIAIDSNRYSVDPNLIGCTVKVRLYRDHFQVWHGDQLDSSQTYVEGRNQRRVLPEHEKIYKTMTGQRQLLEQAFLRLGGTAKTFYEGLKNEKGGAAGYHLKKILEYADRNGTQIVIGAMAQAARYNAYDSESVFRIIKGRNLKRKGKSSVVMQNVPENMRQLLLSCTVEPPPETSPYKKFMDSLADNPEKEASGADIDNIGRFANSTVPKTECPPIPSDLKNQKKRLKQD